MPVEPYSDADASVVEQQLGRQPRGVAGVAWQCPCGKPGVLATEPRLPDGTPFPTTYYLTCPRAVAAVSTLEADGVMAEMSQRLVDDPPLAAHTTTARIGVPGRARQGSARPSPRSAASAPAECRPGSSACMCWWATPSPGPDAASIHSATRRSTCSASSGRSRAGGAVRVAAIDCGTNSVRLLIAEGTDAGFVDLDRDLHLTRLGQGVDATGRFAPDALARTLDAVADFGARIQAAGAERVRFVATSAARDAANRDEFFVGVRERVGVEAEIITGDEEARLSFGAPRSARDVEWLRPDHGHRRRLDRARAGASGRLRRGGRRSRTLARRRVGPAQGASLASDPPTADQVASASGYIDELIDASGVDVGAARTWIGVGGTATALSAINLGLDFYDRTRVQGSVMTRAQVQALAALLLQLPVAEVAAMPTMQPERADVIAPGR